MQYNIYRSIYIVRGFHWELLLIFFGQVLKFRPVEAISQQRGTKNRYFSVLIGPIVILLDNNCT